MAREREAYSRSLEEGGLLGVRPRAKSLGHRISQFFGVGGSNGNTRRPGRSGDANGGSHNVESSPVRSADAEEERTRRRESAVGDDEV